MLKIIQNKNQERPIFYLICSVTGELVQEYFSQAAAEQALNRISNEDII